MMGAMATTGTSLLCFQSSEPVIHLLSHWRPDALEQYNSKGLTSETWQCFDSLRSSDSK